MSATQRQFLTLSSDRFQSNMALIRMCLDQMDAQAVWARPNAAANSVANLCLHLAGNLGQLIGHAVAGHADTRHRDAEFSAASGLDPAQLCSILQDAVDSACAILAGLPPGRLDETVDFRQRRWTVLEVIYKAVEHFALHTGQIIYVAKSAGTIRLT